ncbi:hypothetical protein NOZE110980_18155 [Nocardioides zeicaulis]
MLAPMPRAVRRLVAAASAGGALALALSGCAGIGQPAPYDSPGINGLVVPTPTPDPGDFVATVDNPWFPLEPGAAQVLDVSRDDRVVGSLHTQVVDGTTRVAGLDATTVRTLLDLGGRAEEVDRLYAQDEAGNVWLVGEDRADGGWRAGQDGAEAGLAMPADPRLGDGWLTCVVPGQPTASRTIEEQTPTLVQVRDEAGTTSRSVYEKGVGLVGVSDLDAGWTAAPRS